MGLGAIAGSDPQFLGMLGMHGTYEANMTMQNCDVLLAVGARFDDRVIGNPKHFASVERKIIHVDIDPSCISKRVKVDIPIVGDVKDVLQELIVADQGSAGQARHGRAERLVEPDQRVAQARLPGLQEQQRGHQAADGGRQAVAADARTATPTSRSDVGQHQMWAAQFYRFEEPRRWINSGGLGTMGVGLPYAMGIKLAKPESDVFCITGEGSIQMCIQELSTCLQYKTPVKIVSLNNRYLGMVRQWQELDYGGRYSHSYMDALPDFVKLAEAYGHVGLLVEKPARRRTGAARSDPAEGPHGVPRHPHRPDRKRLADGAGRQGHHRDAARLRGPVRLNRRTAAALPRTPGAACRSRPTTGRSSRPSNRVAKRPPVTAGGREERARTNS